MILTLDSCLEHLSRHGAMMQSRSIFIWVPFYESLAGISPCQIVFWFWRRLETFSFLEFWGYFGKCLWKRKNRLNRSLESNNNNNNISIHRTDRMICGWFQLPIYLAFYFGITPRNLVCGFWGFPSLLKWPIVFNQIPLDLSLLILHRVNRFM